MTGAYSRLSRLARRQSRTLPSAKAIAGEFHIHPSDYGLQPISQVPSTCRRGSSIALNFYQPYAFSIPWLAALQEHTGKQAGD